MNSDEGSGNEENNLLLEVIKGDCISKSQSNKQYFYVGDGLDRDPLVDGSKDSNNDVGMEDEFESSQKVECCIAAREFLYSLL